MLGIFPVAAYNGGPRNVTKLYRVLARMNVAARRAEPPAGGVHRFAGEMSLRLEGGRHCGTSGGDPEIQQREPLVHREVPEHREPVRVIRFYAGIEMCSWLTSHSPSRRSKQVVPRTQ